jgi:hypothetical protein
MRGGKNYACSRRSLYRLPAGRPLPLRTLGLGGACVPEAYTIPHEKQRFGLLGSGAVAFRHCTQGTFVPVRFIPLLPDAQVPPRADLVDYNRLCEEKQYSKDREPSKVVVVSS